MGVEQDKIIKDSYTLTREQLTIPEGSEEVKRLWFESIVALQLEGIEQNVRPRNLFGIIPLKWHNFWIEEVWITYLGDLDYSHRRAALLIRQGQVRQTRHNPKRHSVRFRF